MSISRSLTLRSAFALAIALLYPLAAMAQTPAASSAKDAQPKAGAAAPQAAVVNPSVLIKTSMGDITVELNVEKAPKTVENFLQYVKDGFYNGTIFHRVINNFMIQGGGFTPDLRQKPTRPAIPNEAKNGLSNANGTIAMARTNDPQSATAQFYINVADNRVLDYVSDAQPETWGYAVFGKVISGMDVVDAIKMVPTSPKGPFSRDVPVTDVVIQSVELLP